MRDVLTAIDLASGVKKAVIAAGVATLTNSSADHRRHRGRHSHPEHRHRRRPQRHRQGRPPEGARPDHVDRLRRRDGQRGSARHELRRPGTLIQDGSTLNVNGKIITFKNAAAPLAAPTSRVGSGVSGNLVTDGNGNSTVYLQGGTIADVLKAIDLATGVQTATNVSGAATVSRRARSPVRRLSLRRAAALAPARPPTSASPAPATRCRRSASTATPGRRPAFNAGRNAAPGGISGKTLTFTSFNGGTPVNVTFGDGTNGTVKTLDQLNAALLANNLAATVDSHRQADDHHQQRLRLVDARVGTFAAARSAAR